MKKNNKFRNNGNSNAYSLNYKFDSISPAGKYSGTALDLIKRYNELAKEAQGGGDYVAMEVFRQYAEHYRKIVTEINERKNYRPETQNTPQTSENATEVEPKVQVEEKASEPATAAAPAPEIKTFQVIEISAEKQAEAIAADTEKTKKTIRRRKTITEPELANKENASAV